MIKLFISDLEGLVEKGQVSANNKIIVERLLSAINDWPVDIDSVEDYELAVQDFIKNTTTKKNIENVLNNIDFAKHAWQSESLTQLLEAYDNFKDDTSLKEIIDELKQGI